MHMRREGKTAEDANNRYTLLEDIEEENKNKRDTNLGTINLRSIDKVVDLAVFLVGVITIRSIIKHINKLINQLILII